MTIRVVGSDETWDSVEDFKRSLSPWIAYVITEGEGLVEIGRADTREQAEDIRHRYYTTLPSGHPHRLFRVMGVTSHTQLSRLTKEA